MDGVWKKSLGDRFRETFDRFATALQDCPDALWEESLWEVTRPWPAGAVLGAERPEAERPHAFSAFWFTAWHAVDCAHYDLEGLPFPKWLPPSPFSAAGPSSAIDVAHYLPSRVFTRGELLAYVADARRKAEAIVEALTDEEVARAVPQGHRYAGAPYAWLLLGCLTHSQEHLGQLEMFLGQRGVVRA